MCHLQVLLAACALSAGGFVFGQSSPVASPNKGQALEKGQASPAAAPNKGQASEIFGTAISAIASGDTVLKKPDGSVEATYRYRLIEPRAALMADTSARFPLIVFLHGSGERGDDNARQLIHFAGNCASDNFQREHPCFVLAMQCPKDEVWSALDIKAAREKGQNPHFAAEPTRVMRALMQAIDEVMATKPIDPTRVYLTGLSLGGFGSFDLAMRRPELFAAVVPICGGGDPSTAATLARIPFYIVHGSDDPVVPVELSRTMREAIAGASADLSRDAKHTNDRSAKGKLDPTIARPMPKRAPNPMYREYDGVGHDSWTSAYRFGDDGVLDWMFAQSRSANDNAAKPVPKKSVTK